MSTKLKSLIQQIIKEEVALFEKKKKKDELPPLDVDVDIEIAEQYENNIDAFNQTARAWTEKYAN
jgi:hypothetical protein